MSIDAAFQGSLFANDFLCESVVETVDWQGLDDSALDDLEAALRAIFKPFPQTIRRPTRARPRTT